MPYWTVSDVLMQRPLIDDILGPMHRVKFAPLRPGLMRLGDPGLFSADGLGSAERRPLMLWLGLIGI